MARANGATAAAEAGKRSSVRLPTNLFPLGYKEGFAQWWAAISPAVAEATVLSFLPFNNLPIPTATNNCRSSTGTNTVSPTIPRPDPHGPRECTSTLVELSGKERAINEFTVTRTGEEKQEDLVILHGYGAGLGFFYRNFDHLSRRPGWKLWALDLLGMGRSSRPPFKIHATDKEGKIREAEDWFIDALEEWRIKRGIDRFTLMGHSLGGYLATAYALKHPGRLKKLILASPVGIPEDPWAVKEEMPKNPPVDQSHPPIPETGLQHELLQPDDEVLKPTKSASTSNLPSTSGSPFTHRPTTPLPPTPPPSQTQPQRRRIPKWIHYLWDANISPFSLVRWAGPFGPRLVSGWTYRRFHFLPPEESLALHDYAYSLFRQRGSGEYALAFLLAPGAYARQPLIWRIGKVQVPTVLMYGEVDWMDIAGGYAAKEVIRKEGVRRDSEGWRGGREWRGHERGWKKGDEGEVKDGEKGGGEAKVLVVKGAGHHLYLDGWEEFNGMIWREMEDVEVRERRREEWRKRYGQAARDADAAAAGV